MGGTALLWAGGLIGLSVAAPIGPMGVLCIRRTLQGGMLMGVSTGMGASTVHVGYCALLLLGFDRAAPMVAEHRQALGIASGCLMLLLAWRLVRSRRRSPSARHTGGGSPVAAYASAIGLSLTNPMLLVLLMASSAAVLGPTKLAMAEQGVVLTGLFAGSFGWWLGLSGVTSMLRRRLSTGVLTLINEAIAIGLAGFGMLALARAMLAPA